LIVLLFVYFINATLKAINLSGYFFKIFLAQDLAFCKAAWIKATMTGPLGWRLVKWRPHGMKKPGPCEKGSRASA
jgi:hypothetical protein